MMPWLKALAVEDFRSIRGPVPVSLDAPVVLIQGANGAGKTSLLSALELALSRTVASLKRFDRDYIRHLPHKDSPRGRGRVTLTATGLGEAAFTVTGSAIEGGPALLSASGARFFVERCYLAQATLGRLLEIYEHQDTRRTDSPLTRFVKELLGLEALDALIEGLHSVGDVRRLRATAPLYWVARTDMPRLETNAAAAREKETTLRNELAAREAALRDLAGSVLREGEAIEATALRRTLEALANASESKLRELARRRRDLSAAADQVKEAAAAEAEGARRSAETENTTARESLAGWIGDSGEQLAKLVQAIQEVFPDVPSSNADAAIAHTSATRAVKQERERLTNIVKADADDGRAIVEVQESLRRGTARISAIDSELADVDGANEELARALASISPHIQGESCPVCGRDFSEISSQPLAAHVSEEVARLVAAAGRLQALVRDRSTTASAVAEVQRREAEIAARRLSQSRRDELKVELARLAEWSNSLDSLAEAARAATALQRRVARAAQRLAELNSLNLAVIGLRAEIGRYAADLGMPLPEPDAALESTVGSLLVEVDRQERLAAETKTRRLHAIETLEQVARLRAQLGAAVKTFGDANAALERLRFCKAEAERRIEVARELAGRAGAIRTAKVREVFNDELNRVWQDLFIRLAPDERFVPAFALPQTTTGPVEAILETHYRSGGKGGNPRAMLSAGNLNTAALTLFLALHLSVRPVLPWLVLDDPVQSMDDVHIAQLAALLRTLKQTRRQVVIAVHNRQLFEYLALELSPAFNGDRLITIELGRDADGKTTAPWYLKTFEPDRAIAA